MINIKKIKNFSYLITIIFKEKVRNKNPKPVLIRLLKIIFRHRLLVFKNTFGLKIQLGVTHRCQCKCDHCGIPRQSQYEFSEGELTTNQIKNILKEIALLPYLFITLSFFGGEALLRKDIFSLIEFAHHLGLVTELDSNGISLERTEAQKLRQAGLNHIFISLDSLTPEVQDSIRNYKGIFEKIIAAFKNSHQECLNPSCSVLISEKNIEDLNKIVSFAKKLNLASIRFLIPTYSEKSQKNCDSAFLKYAREKINKILLPGYTYLESPKYQKNLKQQSCAAVKKCFLYISPYGNLQPCPFVHLSFSNVKNNTVKDAIDIMWSSALFTANKNTQCLANEITGCI